MASSVAQEAPGWPGNQREPAHPQSTEEHYAPPGCEQRRGRFARDSFAPVRARSRVPPLRVPWSRKALFVYSQGHKESEGARRGRTDGSRLSAQPLAFIPHRNLSQAGDEPTNAQSGRYDRRHKKVNNTEGADGLYNNAVQHR